MRVCKKMVLAALVCTFVSGCSGEGREPAAPILRTIGTTASSFGEWSAPQPFPAGINSTTNEQNAVLSRDGLSLYFSSNRPGGMGDLDIYIAQRATVDSPWGNPINVGASINTSSADFAPNLSIDGHLLFFSSTRPGGQGASDLYVASRANPNDDFGWENVTSLGTVNTTDFENAPFYLQNAEDGRTNLYFNRGVLAALGGEIYRVAITRQGVTLGDAEPVEELNMLAINEAAVSIRHDGKEMFFWSNRAGGSGGPDIWTSIRSDVHSPWSTPVNAGPALNSSANEVTPSLSFDGLTMVFASTRAGGLGGNDLYFSTRSRK
jgi:Tol biopolymer transport system component